MTGDSHFNRGRIVGIDFGLKRTGLAVADPLRMFARILGTYSPEESLVVLEQLDKTEGIDLLVLGWPLTPEGDEGAAVDRVRVYERRLRKALPNVPLERWDERNTSIEARELMIEAGVRKKRRSEKGRVDAEAAAVILQSYLDATNGT